MDHGREPVRLLSNPSVQESVDVLMGAVSKRRAAIVLGVCEVWYRGRGSTHLTIGDRMVMIKEDGSLLVHRTWGYKPVNYMPPGGLVYARSDGGVLVVGVKRGSETIKISFKSVYTLVVLFFRDESSFEHSGTEAQMRQAVILSPELVERGLRVLTHEFQVRSGFVDLMALDSSGRLVAMEFKANVAKTVDVNQLVAYVSRLRALSKDRPIRGMLVAPGINKAARKLLVESGLEFKRLDRDVCLSVVEEFKPTVDLLSFMGRSEAKGGS